MTVKTINVEANSLEEAREQVKAQIPRGFYIHREQVIQDGKPKSVKASADTMDAAFAVAQSEIPGKATILEKKELTNPERNIIKVEAYDDAGAEAEAKRQARMKFRNAMVKSVKLVMPGSKGFVGLGKKPSQYEAELFLEAVAEITYRTGAIISVEIKEPEREEVLGLIKKIGNIWEPSQTRHEAADTLVKFGGNLVIEQLAELLNNGEIQVRGMAITALQKMHESLPNETFDLLNQASNKYEKDINTIEQQIEPLISLLKSLETSGSFQAYEANKETEAKIRQIGKKINDIGGHSGMWIPYNAIRSQYRYPPLGSILESRWDGIGTWQR